MKTIIKAWLTRTYALRQYENVKPSIEIEIEIDTEKNDLKKTLEWLKKQCEEYIEKFNPRGWDNGDLPFN